MIQFEAGFLMIARILELRVNSLCLLCAMVAALLFPGGLKAANRSAQEVAKEIANPLTDMTYIPIQVNFDRDIGPFDGDRYTINIQPLTSFELNDDWNVISRTIVPIISQDDVSEKGSSESGLGDITQSFFLSPKLEAEGQWSWGLGPIVSLPTASRDELGVDHLTAGITAVAVQVKGPWTYGLLTSYSHSVNKGSNDPRVKSAYFQPFLDYTTETAITYELSSESTYDQDASEWSIPIIFTANKIFPVSNFMMAVGGGPRYWVTSPDSGPEGWGLNISVYFFLPK